MQQGVARGRPLFSCAMTELSPSRCVPRPAPLRAAIAAVLAATLAACTTQPPPDGADWQVVTLPGKPPTRYEWSAKDGRPALLADSERSASILRKRLSVDARRLGAVSFSWWVQDLVPGASVDDPEREDAPARVLFGFDGELRRLPLRTRMQFELVQALTGEMPPYATLMYVWDAQLPVGTVVVSRRSDRIRKIVVDSGAGELRRWREHRRDLAADFRHAFGEEPGPLVSIAYMTDSDNTRSRARCWYGPVQLAPH